METVVVAAGVIFNQGKILITRRRKESHLGRYWEFPGGKKKNQEDLKSCLIREVREELGIQIEVKEEILSNQHEYSDRKVDIHFFRCEWTQGNPVAIGCDEYLWIEEKAIDRFSFPPANLKLIQKLKST